MYTDGNPCEFFSSHFLVKTCQDLRMEHHRRAHLSTFVQSQQSGYPFWKCGWKFMIYPLRNWKYQGYAPPFNHQSWTCKTMKKKQTWFKTLKTNFRVSTPLTSMGLHPQSQSFRIIFQYFPHYTETIF